MSNSSRKNKKFNKKSQITIEIEKIREDFRNIEFHPDNYLKVKDTFNDNYQLFLDLLKGWEEQDLTRNQATLASIEMKIQKIN
jgi:hypothetical protein